MNVLGNVLQKQTNYLRRRHLRRRQLRRRLLRILVELLNVTKQSDGLRMFHESLLKPSSTAPFCCEQSRCQLCFQSRCKHDIIALLSRCGRIAKAEHIAKYQSKLFKLRLRDPSLLKGQPLLKVVLVVWLPPSQVEYSHILNLKLKAIRLIS